MKLSIALIYSWPLRRLIHQIIKEQPKIIKKRKFRNIPLSKRRKLLRFSRLEILHGRQSECKLLSRLLSPFSLHSIATCRCG